MPAVKSERCGNQFYVDPKAVAEGRSALGDARRGFRRCRRRATESRHGFRFGDDSKKEPALVEVRTPLCGWCAAAWDEAAEEAAWEARVS